MTEKKHVNELIREDREKEKLFFDDAFGKYSVPGDIRDAAEHICKAYGIRGVCDPMYIANVIAFHTERGDGKGSFIA